MKTLLNYTIMHGIVSINGFFGRYFGRIHKKCLRFLEKIFP